MMSGLVTKIGTIVTVLSSAGNSNDLRSFRIFLEMAMRETRVEFIMSEVNQVLLVGLGELCLSVFVSVHLAKCVVLWIWLSNCVSTCLSVCSLVSLLACSPISYSLAARMVRIHCIFV